MSQQVEPGGELRFDHSIVYPESILSLTVYFQVSNNGQQARWVEAKPLLHPDGLMLGCDTSRYILAANALGFSVKNKAWISLAEVLTSLEEKGIPFWYVSADDEEAALRREIFEIQDIRKANSRNKEVNRRGKKLVERLLAIMEGRASAFGIVEWFAHMGNGGGWLFKPKGYHGSFMGSHGENRFLDGDDSFPTDQEAFEALEQYAMTQVKEEKSEMTTILTFGEGKNFDPLAEASIW